MDEKKEGRRKGKKEEKQKDKLMSATPPQLHPTLLPPHL